MNINHLAYEIPKRQMGWEVEFWKALGFGRITRPEPKPVSQWLNGGGVFVHLMPTSKPGRGRTHWTHVAFVPRYGLESTLDNLERLPFRVAAEEGEAWWGGRRVFVHSPAGYRLELLEYAPPAKWPAAPSDD